MLTASVSWVYKSLVYVEPHAKQRQLSTWGTANLGLNRYVNTEGLGFNPIILQQNAK